MKRLLIIIIALCLLNIDAYSQSNYAIFGQDEELRGYGGILRFEVRDQESQVPIENVTIEIYGVNNREIAYFSTNNKGVGIFIITDVLRHFSYTPSKYVVKFTKSNYRFYELQINSEDLKNDQADQSIILSRDIPASWSGWPHPTNEEIVRFVNSKNYSTARQAGYTNSGPGVFEYSINLEQIRNVGYYNDQSQGRPNNEVTREDNREYHYDVEMANERRKNNVVNDLINTTWKRTWTGIDEQTRKLTTAIIYIKFIDSEYYIENRGNDINTWHPNKGDWSFENGVLNIMGDEIEIGRIVNDKLFGTNYVGERVTYEKVK